MDYVLANSPFYRFFLKNADLKTGDVKDVTDIHKVPLTTKEDIQNTDETLLCVKKESVSEWVSTTGTTGAPLFFALTDGDLKRLAENERRTFAQQMGVGKGDTVLVSVAMDNLFIAGLAYYLGVKAAGATVVRSGPYNPARQLDLICELNPSAIVAVPSFMLQLAKEAEKKGLRTDRLGIKNALLIGETIRESDFTSNKLGYMVENAWETEVFSTYGITEASVAFSECTAKRGFHAHPDFVYAEVVDDSGEPVKPGVQGELVVTTFAVEAMPLLRYCTGDITFLLPEDETCPCGNKSQRIGPVIGRKAHRLKIKGTTVYPGAIKNALFDLSAGAGVSGYQIEVYSGSDGTDRVKVRVGTEDTGAGFAEAVLQSIRASARFTPVLELLSPPEMQKILFKGGRRKSLTFIDLRQSKKKPDKGNTQR